MPPTARSAAPAVIAAIARRDRATLAAASADLLRWRPAGASVACGRDDRSGRRPPFLAACREPADRAHAGVVHAPGRPLAARVPGDPGRGQHPRRHQRARAGGRDHAAAGAPLRRRRRHPLQRHRRAGRTPSASASTSPRAPGPVVDRAVPHAAPTSTASARSSPRPTRRTSLETVPPRWPRSSTVPLHRLRRRPVHRGQLPDRGPAVAHLRAHQGADARRRRRSGTTLLDRLADLAIASLRARSTPAPRPSSCSTRGPARCRPPTTSATCCPTAAGCSTGVADLGVPAHPLRRRHRRAARADGRGRRRRGRASTGGRRSTTPARRARRRHASCRATSTRRSCLAAVARSSPARRATCSPTTAATRATSSTSATACCPSTDPGVLAAGGRPRPRANGRVTDRDALTALGVRA